MALPFRELQKAVYQKLTTDAPLLSLLTVDNDNGYYGIYDYVTEETPFPYIVIGEPSMSLEKEVKVEDIVEETLLLHVWHNQATSGKYGNATVYDILSAIHTALAYELVLQNYKVMRVTPSQPRVFDDIDNIRKHGVITFKFQLLKK